MKKLLLVLIALFLFTPKYVYASTTLKITNTLENISNKIDASITYKIIPHADNPAGATNNPSEYTLDFTGISVEDNKIVKEGEIDFSNVVYTVPGIYSYGIKQQSISDPNIKENDKMYEIYVNVTSENGNMVVDVQPLVFEFEELEKKELEYTNEIDFTSLTIEQKLSGEYKELDKNTYFKYKITFYSKIDSVYTITGQDEKINYNGEEIETTDKYISKDTEEENYVYIYLKEGQVVTIGLNELDFSEIPHQTEFVITKVDGEKWSTTINGKEKNTFTSRTLNKENKIVITNSRDYDDAVTGLFYNIFPFIIIIPFIILDVIVFKKMKLKKK